MNNYPEVVKQIHNEFNNAGEKLLQQSLSIIANAEKVDVEKVHRLNNAGFISNPLVKQALKIESDTSEPAKMANIVIQYQRDFPAHKFILNKDVEAICDKYGLIHGSSGQYKGFVPEKNLIDIERFESNYRDLKKRVKITELKIEALFTGAINRYFNPKCRAVNAFVRKNKGIFWISRKTELENILLGVVSGVRGDAWFKLKKIKYAELSKFDICAPKKDMISNNMFYNLLPKTIISVETIPDPVVLYPVEHGYIIVTAWGDEASDPLVVNEQMN